MKRMGPTVVVLIALLAVVGQVGADDAVSMLRAELGPSVEHESGKPWEIRYCPDNTCEVFRSAKRGSESATADFAVVYLWAVSKYSYLQKWRKDLEPPLVRDAMRRRGGGCIGDVAAQRYACALRRLARDAKVVVSSLRYDEGVTSEEPVDLEHELATLKVGAVEQRDAPDGRRRWFARTLGSPSGEPGIGPRSRR